MLEKLIEETHGKYCMGDQVTLADAFLRPQYYVGERFNVDYELFPKLKTIISNLDELDAFTLSHPSRQPDAK